MIKTETFAPLTIGKSSLIFFIHYAPHTPSINILQPALLYITKKDINQHST